LTNILWAMAKLTGGAPKGEEMQAFIACAPSAALQQLNDEGSVRKVGGVATSYVLVYMVLIKLHGLSLSAEHPLHEPLAPQVKPQTLSNLLFAFAALDCHPGAVFLASLGIAIERQVQLFKPQELACSLWGFAVLKHHPGPSLINAGLSETRRCATTGILHSCFPPCAGSQAPQASATVIHSCASLCAGNWTSSSCQI
jgi:hypothetical protein